MKYTRFPGLGIVLVAVVLAAGCGNTAQDTAGGSSADDTSVKTSDEYRAEAEREITTENAEAELKKLESEIEADVGAER